LLGPEGFIGESVVGGGEADIGVALDQVREFGSLRLVPLRSAVEVAHDRESSSLSLEVVQLSRSDRLRAGQALWYRLTRPVVHRPDTDEREVDGAGHEQGKNPLRPLVALRMTCKFPLARQIRSPA